jgi:hypothetical protein
MVRPGNLVLESSFSCTPVSGVGNQLIFLGVTLVYCTLTQLEELSDWSLVEKEASLAMMKEMRAT